MPKERRAFMKRLRPTPKSDRPRKTNRRTQRWPDQLRRYVVIFILGVHTLTGLLVLYRADAELIMKWLQVWTKILPLI
jgi:hypothetical protein